MFNTSSRILSSCGSVGRKELTMYGGLSLLVLGALVALIAYFLASGTVSTVLVVIGVVMMLGGLIDLLRRGGSRK